MPPGLPLVSIVIIFLDAEQFLQEAIDSVFAQTYPHWELLLVDDGSGDGSARIAQTCSLNRPRQVHYLHHPGHQNLGMSAARNLGISQARGDFIAFLDADDAYFPQAIAGQIARLQDYPQAALVYGPIQYWYSWTGLPEDQSRDCIESLGVPADCLVPPPTLLPIILEDKGAVPSGIMARREAIDRVGAFEAAFRGEYEDQVFLAKLCLVAPVFAAGTCWYRYRQHSKSSVALGLQSGATHDARLAFLNWLEAYLIQQRLIDRPTWGALRRQLRPFRHPGLYHLSVRISWNLQRGRDKLKRLWA